MFERFTERARQVVTLAQEEARNLKHSYIGTEHLLLGLLREEEGVAARVLLGVGVTVENVRARVMGIVGSGEAATHGQLPFTPRAKRVLELALREALSLGHNYIDTEHILLGLVRENEGVARRVLAEEDVNAGQIRGCVWEKIRGRGEQKVAASRAPKGPDRILRWVAEGEALPEGYRVVGFIATRQKPIGVGTSWVDQMLVELERSA